MKLPGIEDLNSERFLNEAFSEEHRIRWIKYSRIRRNVYMSLFIIAMICVVYTAIINWMTLCILSLFLATISLVVVTKYDTQLCFLKILKLHDEQQHQDPDHA